MKTLILGKGYCGYNLSETIENCSSTELPSLCRGKDIPFDFTDESTWNLPEFDAVVITFKMTFGKQAEKLKELLFGKRIIILSSARCFQNSLPHEIISEVTPLSPNSRNIAESIFLDSAALLHLGLIIGPDREPKKFLEEGRIQNGSKYINFIHLNDIVKIVKFFLKSSDTGRWLISDGYPQRWQKVADSYGIDLPTSPAGLESRRFDTAKLRKTLPDSFSFVNIKSCS